ncbi:MAG TPA: sialate O-acetylesterase [Fibrobacteria bacterium]|nr:sialate O-acetylesterase [Fibrobacteria bacterium]
MAQRRAWLCFCFLALVRVVPVHGVMLGGANVPKEKLVVYILIGHSNMAGIDLSHSDPVSVPHAWNYPVKTRQWVLAKEPVNNKAAGLSGNGAAGPGMPFLKGMAAAYPDYYFGVVTNASLSSTCRGENTGNNSSGLDPSDNRYWDSTYLYDQIITAAKAVQKEATLGGILCMLGTVEATRTNGTVCRAFSDDIASLARFFRRDLDMPQLPFIMGEYEAGATGSFAPTLPLPAIILEQIKLIPSKLPFSATVNSQGIRMLDDHHYTGNTGQQEWAKRAIAVIQANNWFPPGATAIRIAAPGSRAAALQGPWLLAEPGAMTLRSDEGIFLINGAGVRPLPIKE